MDETLRKSINADFNILEGGWKQRKSGSGTGTLLRKRFYVEMQRTTGSTHEDGGSALEPDPRVVCLSVMWRARHEFFKEIGNSRSKERGILYRKLGFFHFRATKLTTGMEAASDAHIEAGVTNERLSQQMVESHPSLNI